VFGTEVATYRARTRRGRKNHENLKNLISERIEFPK